MILLVLEAHGALHFGGSVDKAAEGITRERVIIAAGVHVFELAGFVIAPLRISTLEKKSFDFVRSVQSVTLLFIESFCVVLENAANVAGVARAVFIDHFSEHQHLAGTEHVRRSPVKRGPVNAETKIALPLCGKAADR